MINKNLNLFSEISNLNNLKTNSCEIFKKIPLILWILFGIIFIFILYNYFNSKSNNKDYKNLHEEYLDNTVEESFESNLPLIKVINFNTKWCHHSKALKPEWDKFTNYINNVKETNPSLNIEAHDIDCDDPKNTDLVTKYDIKGYPYIIIETPDQTFEYEGERKAEDIINKINEMLSN